MKTWIYISLAGLTLLVTLLGFLFGTDIVGRFSQPETRAERRVHATYSLKQAPFVHPQIIGDLIGILSDVGDQVVAINLLDSQDSNRYFGKIFVTPQTDPLVPSWPWVSTRNRDLNKDEEGGDFPRQEYHAYRYLGLTLSGLEVLHIELLVRLSTRVVPEARGRAWPDGRALRLDWCGSSIPAADQAFLIAWYSSKSRQIMVLNIHS